MAQQQISDSSAAYREKLGNIDATTKTIKGMQEIKISWPFVVIVLLLLAGIVYLIYRFWGTLKQTVKTVTAPLNNTAAAAGAERRTQTLSNLEQAQIDRMADGINSQFTCPTTDARVLSITNNLLSLQSAADWDRLLTAYGERTCCFWHTKAGLQKHLTVHLNDDERLVIRNHLYKIGVRDPGF